MAPNCDSNASQPVSMSVSGQSTIGYSFDLAGRLTQMTQGAATVKVDYDNGNRPISTTLPNGVQMLYAYDAGSQVTGMTYKVGSTTLGNLSYAYDTLGRQGRMGGSFARIAIPTPVLTTSYNAANQVTTWGTATLSYDANGSLTSDGTYTYTWNARNQLSNVKQKSNGATLAGFGYDAYGRRLNKTVGTTTNFVYRGINPVQEIGGTTTNIWSNGTDRFFKRGNDTLLQDALGSNIAVVDGSGVVQTQYTYEPFGKTTVTGAANANSYQFTSRENDNVAGLYFYRARYYSTSLQRFISQDPIGFRSGDYNLYAYVKDNPVELSDPLGLATGIGCAIGSSAGRGSTGPIPGGPNKDKTWPNFPVIVVGPDGMPVPAPGPGQGQSPKPGPGQLPMPGQNGLGDYELPIPVELARRACSCTTTCYFESAGSGSTADCSGWASGSGTGGTENEACKAAKKDASNQAPRGCKTKHCDPCTCTGCR